MSTLSHAEAVELSGLYVLDALSPEERAAVDAHVAGCAQAHDEFAEVGGVAPALATLADPKGAPAALKSKVLADYRAGAGAKVWEPAASAAPARPSRNAWLGWAAAGLAVLLIATLAGWGYTNITRNNEEAQRQEALANAFDILAAPGSSVALLRGKDAAAGASGFAAFDSNGVGYIVVVDLPAAPSGRAYQAWYIANGTPISAGLLNLDGQGFAMLKVAASSPSPDGSEIIALTIEPAGGSERPTTSPIVDGRLQAHA